MSTRAGSPATTRRTLDAVRKLEALAAGRGATVSQLAVAWLPARCRSPGTRHVAAADFELTPTWI
ncbi:hypothetical protein [Actinoplanes sp. M2I2]|uniref:hypothetical protein n=1 Tax=Actinoplanes sp. M2I2 TaxID=1734444 RepID=UPI00201FF9FD|nr:hypothetical protein [Actinoplanes sp. M2I2]